MSTSNPQPPDVELSPTGRVILGMIAFGKRTGYDIKTFVDRTTRYFWAASYGQIYPELRRLEKQGLVRGRPEPSGGRARTVYELTEAGRAALEYWLGVDEEQRIEIVSGIRAREERDLAHLRSIEPHAKKGPTGSYLTLQMGIEFTESVIKWCEETERRLASETEEE
jgi:PadR family transcriptional regulator AphA